MHDLYNLKEMLCKELSDYGKEGGLTLASLATIDTLAHACKNVCKIIECKEKESYGGNGEYSRGYYYDDGGMSNRRGRAMNGRFVSRDASDMAHKLREMMRDAPDESARREIERLADRMEQM